MPLHQVSPVFAGREHELAVLLGALGQAREGDPRVVLIGGEAGVGKTRLTSEFAARAEQAGALVLSGGCVELSSSGLPYAPFTAALRGLVRDLGPEGTTALLPHDSAGDLSRLLPELGTPPAETDRDIARMRLFEHVLALLDRLAADRPAVLIVEDAHWADHSTRDLLSFLTRNLHGVGVLLAVTYRADDLHRRHPLRPLLAELSRVGIVTRLELPRLTRAEVAAQLGGLLGHAADPALAELVHARSEGIPLFVEAALGPDGTPADDLPESLRDLLLSGVQRLPEETQRVLRVATVAGDRAGHALLAAVTGLDDTALSDRMRPAVTGNVLVTDVDGYAFRHALIREAVRGELLPGERTALHRRYAEALAANPALGTGGRPSAELAAHWAAAHDNERALLAAWDAAAECAAALSYAEGLQMLELVLELWERVPGAATRIGADHTAVLERAAETAYACGETDRGLRLASAAIDALDGDAEPERKALVHLERARLRSLGGGPGALTDLRAAERLVPGAGPVRASVLALLGGELTEIGETETGHAMIEEAVALAARLGDAAASADALTTSAFVAAVKGDLASASDALEGSRSMAEQGGSARRLLRAFVNLSAQLILRCRYAKAIATAREGITLAHRLGQIRAGGGYIAGNLIEAQFALGRWDDLAASYEEAMRLDPNPPLRGQMLIFRAQVALARGETPLLNALTEQLGRFAARLGRFGSGAYACLLIDHRTAEGDIPGALATAQDALDRFGPTGNPWYLWPILHSAMRACAAAGRGRDLRQDPPAAAADGTRDPVAAGHGRDPRREQTSAAALRRALVEVARDVPAGAPFWAVRKVAFAAEAAGVGDLPAWEAAVAAWEAAGEPYPLAEALARAAEACAAASDRDGAAVRLARAAEIAGSLRARPLAAEIDRLARRIGVAARPGGDAHGLTSRELEVLRLIAAGRSNRELAGELFISVKTAGVHVSNILGKLGVASRGEAAALAHRLRLFD
ncbi:LuxR family transcriptional regulator [Spongiactinospora gelatinilytica]|uniref:LuxR family transcriptional regulator n=1 Tax=Spongiactinospora gelatinilytica TaxID=2666298 RepID=A0A2W2H4E9_9ACTN|nr:helix-turn-helix transcriptional regulator [Spongiactinospora gelatinilytica]PZG49739.1 LuxR family transcriptional regulator [Spongiactinospora gelatinilytica]